MGNLFNFCHSKNDSYTVSIERGINSITFLKNETFCLRPLKTSTECKFFLIMNIEIKTSKLVERLTYFSTWHGRYEAIDNRWGHIFFIKKITNNQFMNFSITGAKILPVWCQQDKAGAWAWFPGSPPEQGARMEPKTWGSRQGHHRA